MRSGLAWLSSVLWVAGVASSPMIEEGSRWVEFKDNGGSQRDPPRPLSSSWQDKDTTIFVGIASFRDKRCSDTLKALYANADNPERIFAGVINHIHTEQDHGIKCLESYCASIGQKLGKCNYEDQITVMDVSFLDAKSPGTSRVMQESLFREQEFCLQVDAHSHFVKGWDTLALQEWGKTENEYAIISTKPPELDVRQREVNHICEASFTK